MDHQRGSSVGEHRVRAFSQRHIGVSDGHLGFAGVVNDDVLHITSVRTFRIVEPVLPALWVEMRTGRLEVRGITFRILMKMDGVLSGRYAVQVELDLNSLARALDGGAADSSSARVFDVYPDAARKHWDGEQNYNGRNEAIQFHAAHYTDKEKVRTGPLSTAVQLVLRGKNYCAVK